MKKLLLGMLCVFTLCSAEAQLGEEFTAYFNEAYNRYPNIPRGVLEAVAYTKTRIQHLVPRVESCQGLPYYVTVMGLVEDGKGYFNNTLARVAQLSDYSEQEIKSDPRISILAYAAAYEVLQRDKKINTRSVGNHEPIIADLSEIPEDGSALNDYAHDQEFYQILNEIEKPHTSGRLGTRQSIDYEAIFGKEKYQILSAPSVSVSPQSIRNTNGIQYLSPQGVRSANCTSSNTTTDYRGAVWVPAHPNNYGSRSGADISYATIHTIQGSYASAISWFKHSSARVSAHYIIRASDGQITQMVCEKDKAFHVRTDNDRAIGIEHEGFVEDGFVWYTEEMYKSSAELVKDICRRNTIDPLKMFAGLGTRKINPLSNECYHIKGHQHFRNNTHVDPGEYWDWAYFFRLVNGNAKVQRFTSSKGDIYDSGGANGDYQEMERSGYLISPSRATSINLTFNSFDLEGNNQQAFDYILVYDGEGPAGRFLGKFSGNEKPPDLIANSGKAYIEFRSDCRVNGSGFHIRYTSTRKEGACPVPQNLTASNLLPMAATLKWNDVKAADEYEVFYRSPLADPTWVKLKTTQNSLTITGLAAGNIYEWQVRSICGRDTSGWVGSNFRTRAISRKGSPFNIAIKLSEGYFRDSGGRIGTYVDNEAYIYTIVSPNDRPIKVTFSDFETEKDLDILTIYDGANSTSASIIGEFSGNEIPESITSSAGALTFKFISNSRTVKEGWSAYWQPANQNAPPPNDNSSSDNNNNGEVVDNNGNNTGNGNSNSDPLPAVPLPSNLDPNLNYASNSPRTDIPLDQQYSESFNLKFNDTDRSGRGLANRFYNIAEKVGNVYDGNPSAGFLYDNFDFGLSPKWTITSGNWRIANGMLQQINANEDNSNIYAFLEQDRNHTYLYHFQASISGSGNNKRIGLHFFSNYPNEENRGNSYFVWFRNASSGDKVEIYETRNNKFDRKVSRSFRLDDDRAYDFKIIYNPRKGRIEIYINNRFAASWVDPSPITSGNAISFRSGGSIMTVDNIIVYQSRSSNIPVKIGKGEENQVRTNGFQVASLIVDRNIRWSPVAINVASVSNQDMISENPDQNTPPPTDDNDKPSNDNNIPVSPDVPVENVLLKEKYSDDFSITLPQDNTYYMVAQYDGAKWSASRSTGFFLEDFNTKQLPEGWTNAAGDWQTENGYLQQNSLSASNSNLYTIYAQNFSQEYLYHMRARILQTGANVRFGLHFQSTDGRAQQRGNSYLIWFRHSTNNRDLVEVYRSSGDDLPLADASFINLVPQEWYDIKIQYDPISGTINVYLNNKRVLNWEDPKIPLSGGQYLSLRTGNSQVQFDDLLVFRKADNKKITITVGEQENDIIRVRSLGNQSAARLYTTYVRPDGTWAPISIEETQIQ